MVADEVGELDLRAENINKAVKGFGLKKYKLMQVLQKTSSSAWTETYYRETATELTAQAEGQSIQGIARGATFPHVDPSWTKVQGRQVKFGSESRVMMEDKLMDAIDVQARTIMRVARSIANAVDAYIYTELSGASGVNTAAAVDNWDSATVANRDPIRDILTGIQYLDVDNYDALENGYLLVSPLDYTNLMMNTKVINNPCFKTADVVSNGVVGQVCGLKIIVSTSVTADQAMIIVGQKAATWRSVVGMTSAVIEDKGKDYIIRSWQIGQCQITDPEAIHIITDTQLA